MYYYYLFLLILCRKTITTKRRHYFLHQSHGKREDRVRCSADLCQHPGHQEGSAQTLRRNCRSKTSTLGTSDPASHHTAFLPPSTPSALLVEKVTDTAADEHPG